MNFDHIPELSGLLGYPVGLALMVSVCTELYLVFSGKGGCRRRRSELVEPTE